MNQAVAGGSTALWIAAQNGHAECIALLLKAGAAVDAPNKKGVTPLSVAVHQAHSECVGALVAGGGDPKRVSDLVLQKEAGPLSLMIQSAARNTCCRCKEPKARFTCRRCGCAKYCRSECQKFDFQQHKAACKAVHRGAALVNETQ